jgi:hypothetical protein
MGTRRLEGVLPLMTDDRTIEDGTTPEPHLASIEDDLDMARRLREALWPGEDHSVGAEVPDNRPDSRSKAPK